jgi:enterochelin esterase-like enzyme
MKHTPRFVFTLSRHLRPFLLTPLIAFAEPEFPLTADSKPQPGVPAGTMVKDAYVAVEQSVFPGTEREYQIYLPHGFDKTKPVPFMVFQDGVIYQAPVVFDNLIAKKDIPPLVGIFIKPGVVPAANENALPRFNRSYEYDSVTDTYSRFLIEEFLPAVERRHGLTLSTDANDTAIAGNSSGGICAFMAAWHRPDRFRRVFTGVGTYVGIRGADQLPVLVRKIEPKPIRVFLQSGTGDNNLYCGDWWMANQMMERSLSWAGYDVNHAWGEGGHNQKHASQVFPEAMRWLWRDWQTSREIKANPRGESEWKGYEVCVEGNGWVGFPASEGGRMLSVDLSGKVSVADQMNKRAVRRDGLAVDGLKGVFPGKFLIGPATWAPDQTLLYASSGSANRIFAVHVDEKGNTSKPQAYVELQRDDWSADCSPGGLCVDTEGRLYAATSLGIQVCDQAGRVNFIIPTPAQPYDVCFGGKDLSELFIACGDAIYKRPTKARGYISGQMAPVKPAPPKL